MRNLGHGTLDVEACIPDPSNSHHLKRHMDGLAVPGGGGHGRDEIGDRRKERSC